MFGFSPVIVSLVMNSISSSPVSLLGKGVRLRASFRGEDCVKVTPFLLFSVLCMERLGEMISRAVLDGDRFPIQII